MRARNLTATRALVDIGGLERVRLNAGLINQGEPSRRAGRKHEFGSADHRSGGAG